MEYQLRDYKVKKGQLSAFVREWLSKVYPLRLKSGFRVIGAWTVGKDRFIWMLGWEGPGEFEEADRSYYQSPERTQLKPDPARHLAGTSKHMMTSVL